MHGHRRVGAARIHRHAGTHPDGGLRRRLAHRAGDADDLRRRDQRLLLAPFRRAVLELEVPPLHEAERLLLDEGRLVDRAVRRRTGSSPSLKSPTNSRFHRPSVSSTCAIAPASAPSVPGLIGSHSCDFAAELDSRGSTVITVPRATISWKRTDRVGHHPVRGQWIAAPDHEAIRLLEVVVAVAEEALRQSRAHLLGFGADRAVREVVGRPVDLRQRAVEQFGRRRRVPAAHVHELVRLVVLAQLHHLAGDRVERLVPRDRHELRIDAAALGRIGPLHRHLDPVGVVDLLRDQVAARADVAVVGLRKRIAAHAHGAAVLDEDLDRAPLRAALAGARDPVALGGSGGSCLAHRHRAGDGRGRLCRASGDEHGRRGARRLNELPSRQSHGAVSVATIRVAGSVVVASHGTGSASMRFDAFLTWRKLTLVNIRRIVEQP